METKTILINEEDFFKQSEENRLKLFKEMVLEYNSRPELNKSEPYIIEVNIDS